MFLGTQAIAATAMIGKELQALLSDGKVIAMGGPKEGYSGELSLLKDGTAHGQVKLDSGDVISIDGVWHISGNTFCRTWKGVGTRARRYVIPGIIRARSLLAR